MARQLHDWYNALTLHWDQIHFGNVDTHKTDNGWSFQIQVYLGEILPEQVSVELHAEDIQGESPLVIDCTCKEKLLAQSMVTVTRLKLNLHAPLMTLSHALFLITQKHKYPPRQA